MADELILLEKASLKIREMTLGAGPAQGGTRKKSLTVGGQSSLPFLSKEGDQPHPPLIAAEITDVPEDDWPQALKEDIGKMASAPVDWAARMVEEAGVDLVCLKLQGIHPDGRNASAPEAQKLVSSLLKRTGVPLVILGCGDRPKDNEVLPALSLATKGESLLFGDVVQEDYKTLAASCMADGHNIIAESPIDVNIAKQLNILISDLGMPLERVIMNPTIGALGYGLEYAYSIMERARSAALAGDMMLALPFICFVGQEAWRAKEAKAGEAEFPQGGDARSRGIMWEVLTATAMLYAGADILTMKHPQAIRAAKAAISDLTKK